MTVKKYFLLSFALLSFFFSFSQTLSLDPGFGQNGITKTSLVPGFTSAARQDDGKLVAATGTLTGFTVVRFNPDGTVDNSFGTNGTASVTFASVPWPYFGNLPNAIGGGGQVRSIAVNKEGKIAVAGSAYYSGWFTGPGFAVAIFNADGTPADGNSIITPVLNTRYTGDIYVSNMLASSVTVQSDGKFVVVGDEQSIYGLGTITASSFVVARYNTDGSLEKLVRIGVPRTERPFLLPLHAYSVAVQRNGQIIVAGEGANAMALFDPVGRVLLRYNADLTLDNTFGIDGIAFTPFLINFSEHSIALQDDGKILAIGMDNSGLAVARYNTNGTLDNAFGTGGIVSTGLPAEYFSFSIPALTKRLSSITILADGKIEVAGSSGSNVALARINTDGTLDNSFGNGGKASAAANISVANLLIALNRYYAVGSSQGMGAIAAFVISNTCTAPTLRNDATIVLDADCAGNGGLITLVPTSGTAPFMYSIDGGMTYVNGPATGYSFQELHTGTYQLRIKDANGCESAVVTKEVRKFFGGPQFKNDGTIVLDASCGANDGNISIIPTCGAAPFQYSIDGGMTYVEGPATGYTFQNLAPRTYQLRLKDAYGTESAIVTRQVRPDFYGPCATVATARPAAIGAQAKEGVATLQAYPNPSTGRFQVQLGRFSSPRVQLQVVDARGTVLQQRTLNAEQTSVVDVDLSGKAKGLYLIRVVSDKGTQQTKVLLQ